MSVVGMAVVEEILHRVLEDVLDGELDIDDVFVIGEHQGLFQHLVALGAAIADFDGAHPRHIHQFVGLEGVRQAPSEARFGGFFELAELKHDAALGLVDDVEAGGQPDEQDENGQEADAAAQEAGIEVHLGHATVVAAIAAALLAQQAGKTPVEIAPEFFQVRRPLVGPARVIFAAIVAAAAIAPLGVVERH